MAPNGLIYVADTENNRIQEFDAEGGYVRQWGEKGMGQGQFDSPAGITIGPDVNVYVVDKNNDRVQMFSLGGTYIEQFRGQLKSPTDVAVHEYNGKYRAIVTDSGNNRIVVFNPTTRNMLTSWNSRNNQSLSNLTDLTIDKDGLIYVADTNNSRFQVFTITGKYEGGSGKDLLNPHGITVDSQGNVNVSNKSSYDWDGNRIDKFDSQFKQVKNWGTHGNGTVDV